MKKINSSWYLFLLISYCLSPIDIIPECIFGFFGLIDDLIIFCIVFFLISNYYYKLMRKKSLNRIE